MRILKILIFFISLTALGQETQLSKAEVEVFQKEMARQAENLQTLMADFVQSKHMQMMDEAAESRGRVYFRAPDVLKWVYYNPYDYQILFKDNRLFINDEGHKSVTDTNSNKLFGKLAKLISGSVNGKLLEDCDNFKISYYRLNGAVMARMVPKDENIARMFDEIVLIFNGQNLVKIVKLKEESGDYTRIEFSNIRVNQEIAPQIFEK